MVAATYSVDGDLERAQAEWQRRFGPAPGMDQRFLPQYCSAVRTQQEQCRRLERGEPADPERSLYSPPKK